MSCEYITEYEMHGKNNIEKKMWLENINECMISIYLV